MKKIFLIIAVLITITACSKDNNPNAVNLTESSEQTSSANKSTTRETKNVGETKIRNQTLNLAESLGCSENTAQSLCDQLEEITQKSIADIEMIQKNAVRYLKVTANDGSEYYAELSKGHFIAAVYADSIEGERIYRAIQ